jgi:hypothetical protein
MDAQIPIAVSHDPGLKSIGIGADAPEFSILSVYLIIVSIQAQVYKSKS